MDPLLDQLPSLLGFRELVALKLVSVQFSARSSAVMQKRAETVKRFFRTKRRPSRRDLVSLLSSDALAVARKRRAAFLLYGLYYPRCLVADQVRLISTKAPRPEDRARARELCEQNRTSALDLARLVREMEWRDLAYVGW